MTEQEKREQVERICRKLASMTDEQLQEFQAIVKAKNPDLWQSVFSEAFG